MTKGIKREWSIVSEVAVRLNKMRTETRSLWTGDNVMCLRVPARAFPWGCWGPLAERLKRKQEGRR